MLRSANGSFDGGFLGLWVAGVGLGETLIVFHYFRRIRAQKRGKKYNYKYYDPSLTKINMHFTNMGFCYVPLNEYENYCDVPFLNK